MVLLRGSCCAVVVAMMLASCTESGAECGPSQSCAGGQSCVSGVCVGDIKEDSDDAGKGKDPFVRPDARTFDGDLKIPRPTPIDDLVCEPGAECPICKTDMDCQDRLEGSMGTCNPMSPRADDRGCVHQFVSTAQES